MSFDLISGVTLYYHYFLLVKQAIIFISLPICQLHFFFWSPVPLNVSGAGLAQFLISEVFEAFCPYVKIFQTVSERQESRN